MRRRSNRGPGWARTSGLSAVLIALLGGTALAQSSGESSATIEAVEVRGEAERAEVAIRGQFAVPTYAIRSREDGRVVVIDVADAELPEGGLNATGGSRLVSSTVGSTTARGVRLELRLERPVTYRARSREGRIFVRLDAREDEGSAPSPAVAPSEQEGPATVRDVTVERRDGRERVVIELDRPARFRVDRDGQGPALLSIDGARLAPELRRLRRGLPESLVRRVRVRYADGRTQVEVDRQAGAVGTAIRSGRRIVWMFEPGAESQGRPRSRTVARERDFTAETPEVAAFLSDVPMQVRRARGNRRYAGRRIDLDFKDADIHNILRLLAEVGGVNIITTDDVSGSVTIRMQNVPWDQALDVILRAKGLGMERRGNLIRVAPIERLQKEAEAAVAAARAARELAPLETRIIPVSYADPAELAPRVGELLSERGSVAVDERTNVLIVRDVVDGMADVEELVRTLDTQTPQVLIEARIVEATSQYTRDVGIQWGGDVTMSSANGNPTGLVFPNNIGLTGGNYDNQTPTGGLSPFQQNVNPPNFAVNLPAITGTGQGGALGLTLGSVGGNVNLNVRLSAAEANGTVRIISSPRILTLTNHEAHIAQGTLIPFSQVSAQGVNTAFQEAKLELRVTPQVTADGSVLMDVEITRDEPDFTRTSTRGDPTILKREAETTLLIPDGNTAVIGGIYTRNTGRNVDQVPFFGDIPVLGVLFQRRRVRDERNELLIFLTPRIVNRAEALPE
ncbi:MAG TPA: type IV pilus secretin PilQ [Polyangiaceae bacterium LLY-WYZ-15_(1-7)]|nr:pilus assembly protein PilQ [Sandaracinus sp.]HJL03024.1 type IV pilus secretin PilQ [Polyangiaceae bacterium LLY-WYZ-15_(1-7)]HJL07819.1 type IV pilus secretin PilQ [Polyangiaceae bacterium LLY-WYZ-15_(1-7)]HJL39436.1 type IV pilus secretin PilQ [Polyangiaceae bacterium LLY-WYZ-15_(1-7)]